ncbi:type I-E CRISPR-associated protein Cas7/Cse4/CasC [Streptomyces sp. NPDC050704]|uniref:type I-E CRISPR-associated protein Cas7/Cse4/CasC n=1 Tax=Streptomyces sp. NPDC050704 TaxID=3157219 RepID=UPI003434AFAA
MNPTDLAVVGSTHRLIDTTGDKGPFVVVHSLTTLLGVCLNRDMEGLPKAIVIGGTERMRVSSQSLIRAARTRLRTQASLHEQGASSRLLPHLTAVRLQERGYDAADTIPAAALVVTAAGPSIDPAEPDKTRAMTYVAASAPAQLAELAAQYWDDIKDARQAMEILITEAVTAATTGKRSKKTKNGTKGADLAGPTVKPTDLVPVAMAAAAREVFAPGLIEEIALFGRMLAEIPSGHVNGAASVAHAFSVDPMELLTDEFTAKDDWQHSSSTGAGMIGEQYLTSGTLYRYAALDRRALRANLADSGADAATVEKIAQRAEQRFVTAMTYALPSARGTRTGSAAWPTLAVAATCNAPMTAGAAFETAITPPVGLEASERLARYLHSAQLNGGTARWLSPANQPAPSLPDAVRLEAH